MTLFNGLKTILLIAMYLEYDKYRIVITRLYVYQLFNLIIRSNSVYFFNLYVLLIRATCFIWRLLHFVIFGALPPVCHASRVVLWYFYISTSTYVLLIHFAKLRLFSLSAGHAFLPKVKLTRMDLFSFRYSSL